MQSTTSELRSNRLRLQGLWESIPGSGLLSRLEKVTTSQKFNARSYSYPEDVF